MSSLPEHVELSTRSRRLFRQGQAILVAVSGGVDSMVLLHLLQELAAGNGYRLTVAHLNHQLRGRSSEADERLVRRTAEKLRLPVLIERADVRRFAQLHKLSLEMAAREVQHDFLARAARRKRIRSVALAHHADDQLELFFLRLLRGSGGEGLAGMKWRNPSPSGRAIELVRPLLDQPKAALRAYAAERNVQFREDASNASLDIVRNRIRNELVPLLRRKYQPALDRTISRVMEIIAAETEFVSHAARDWLRLKKRTAGNSVAAQAKPFDKLPVAIQRRCIGLQLLDLGVVADYDLIEQLRSTAQRPVIISAARWYPPRPRSRPRNGRCGFGDDYEDENEDEDEKQARARPGHSEGPERAARRPVSLCVRRDASGKVHLRRVEPVAFRSDSLQVDLGTGAGETAFGGVRIRWKTAPRKSVGPPKPMPGREFFDADKIGASILLRHWRPGDRFQPIGMASAVKLQDLFVNQKVPRQLRHRLVVAATAENEVFWVEGLRISERFKLTEGTKRPLQWRWQRP